MLIYKKKKGKEKEKEKERKEPAVDCPNGNGVLVGQNE